MADLSATAQSAAPGRADSAKSVFSPSLDFLCLGGGSLLLLPVLLLLPDRAFSAALSTFVVTQNLVNFPHFTASYVLFYKGFFAHWRALGAKMRARFLFAGAAIPLISVCFFFLCFYLESPALLGHAGAIMTFLVGWHYVKQGYGILSVDAGFKNIAFDGQERKILLYNAYGCWFLFWICALSAPERQMWGVTYPAFEISTPLVVAALGVCLFTTAQVLRIFLQRRKAGLPTPWNGVIAYFTSLYFWPLARIHPAGAGGVALFHSLQYLFIVSRLEINRSHESGQSRGKWDYGRLFRFAVMTGLIAYLGFWLIPLTLDDVATFDKAAFGDHPFMFIFWIFINIHHYFIDNVIWRGEYRPMANDLFRKSAPA